MPADLFALVGEYHRALPERMRRHLNGRGIPDDVIDVHQLGWSGQRITIPIFNREGALTFFKLARDPDDPMPGPKTLTSAGGSLELYGWERVLAKPCRIVICEGEFDRLVLEAQGFPAVTSTGGTGAFTSEWAADFSSILEVFVCFDRDEAGRRGALRVAQLIPHAKIVELPPEVGDGGDVTDFFVHLGRTRDEFIKLLDAAIPAPPAPAVPHAAPPPNLPQMTMSAARVSELKAAVVIADIVSQYVTLRPSGSTLRGRCPFHNDEHPSFVVYPASAAFHCFGCGRHGDVITFLMSIGSLSFTQALEVLERLAAEPHDEQPAAHG